jgi:hypothetical protein
MLKIYEDAVGEDHVPQTREVGTVRLEVEPDGVARLITEEGPDYARDYGWDDDGGGDDGGGKRPRSVPPAAPPPGFERVLQKGPRRDRYGT